MNLVYWCDACKEPIFGRDGYLHVDQMRAIHIAKDRGQFVAETLREFLDPDRGVPWHKHHARCDTSAGDEGPQYWIELADVRTDTELNAHFEILARSTWCLNGTNWDDFVDRILQENGLSAPEDGS